MSLISQAHSRPTLVMPPAGGPLQIDYLLRHPAPKDISREQWFILIRQWLNACPYYKEGSVRISDIDAVYLLIHFAQGRLHYDPSTNQLFFIDKTSIEAHSIATWTVRTLALQWIGEAFKVIRAQIQDDESEVTSPLKKTLALLDNMHSKLVSGKMIPVITGLLTEEMKGLSKSAKPLAKDELPIQVNRKDGTIGLMIYSMRNGTLREPKLGENVSQYTDFSMDEDFSLDGITEGVFQASRFYSILRNFFLGDPNMAGKIDFFSRWMAYNLAMGNTEQIYTWWTGASGTGKSVVIDLMMAIRGHRGAIRLDPCLYQKGTTNPTALYQRTQLKDKALSYCSELTSGYVVDGEKLKGDTDVEMTARAPKENAVHFKVTHSHVFLGNDLPVIHDQSNSLGRRGVHIVTGGEQYRGSKIDDFYMVLLKSEMKEIFYYIKKGFADMETLGGLKAPEEFNLSTTSNKLEVSEDWFKDFWTELTGNGQIHVGKEKEFILGVLYKEKFLPWWNDNCPKRIPPRVNEFGKVLRSANVAQYLKHSNGKIFYTGAEIVGHEVVVLRKKKVHHLSEEDLDKLAMEKEV